MSEAKQVLFVTWPWPYNVKNACEARSQQPLKHRLGEAGLLLIKILTKGAHAEPLDPWRTLQAVLGVLLLCSSLVQRNAPEKVKQS